MNNYSFLKFSSLFTTLNFGCVKEIESVSIEKPYSDLVTKKRNYYQAINLEYLNISQSIEKPNEEMKLILLEVGKSNGLNVYDEFHNAFIILPDENNDEDVFLGYSIVKLGWGHAQNK